MLKRKTHTPQIDAMQCEGFFMLTKSDAARVIASRLTGSQLRLWLYLMSVDTFADVTSSGEKIYRDLPTPVEIAIAIGASARTVEKDIKVLRDLKLYDYRVTGWQGHNLSAEKARAESERLKKAKCLKPAQGEGGYLTADPVKQPESVLNNRESGYLTADPAILCNEHNKDRARDQTSSDHIQTDQDLNTQERVQENLEIEAQRLRGKLPPQSLLEKASSTESLVESPRNTLLAEEAQIVPANDQSSEPPLLPTKKYAARDNGGLNTRTFNPIKGCDRSCASDPWMESQYKPNRHLVQWLLNDRIDEQKNSLERNCNYKPRKNKITSEIRNDAAHASDLWEDFLEAMHHRVEIHNTRVANGFSITANEQQAIAEIAPYSGIDVAPLLVLAPAPMSSNLPATEKLPANLTANSAAFSGRELSGGRTPSGNVASGILPPERCLNLSPLGADNIQAYKEYQSETAVLSIEEAAANYKRLGEMARAFKSMPKATTVDKPTCPIAKHKAWLKSEQLALRTEAKAWAKRNELSLEIEYDEYGNIIDFEELQF